MLTTPVNLLNAVSMDSNITSEAQQLTNTFGYAIQAVYTGTPNGTLKLQGSLDNSVWDDIENSSVSVSTAGSKLWNIADAFYPYVKLVYTASSGSGYLTAKFYGKGI